MPKKGAKKSKSSEVRREMMEDQLKQVAAEDLLINQKKDAVNEATEGFFNNAGAEESAEPQGELNNMDYTSAGEGSAVEDEEEDGQESVEQEEMTAHVRYFYEDDDEQTASTLARIREPVYMCTARGVRTTHS